MSNLDLKYKENYSIAYKYLEEYAKEENAKYYEIVEDSYEFDYGLMLIVYDDKEHEFENYHICIDILSNQVENGGTWR